MIVNSKGASWLRPRLETPATAEYLKQVLEAIRTKHVTQWAKDHLGPSLQGLRQQTLGRLTAEQIQDKLLPVASPTF